MRSLDDYKLRTDPSSRDCFHLFHHLIQRRLIRDGWIRLVCSIAIARSTNNMVSSSYFVADMLRVSNCRLAYNVYNVYTVNSVFSIHSVCTVYAMYTLSTLHTMSTLKQQSTAKTHMCDSFRNLFNLWLRHSS